MGQNGRPGVGRFASLSTKREKKIDGGKKNDD